MAVEEHLPSATSWPFNWLVNEFLAWVWVRGKGSPIRHSHVSYCMPWATVRAMRIIARARTHNSSSYLPLGISLNQRLWQLELRPLGRLLLARLMQFRWLIAIICCGISCSLHIRHTFAPLLSFAIIIMIVDAAARCCLCFCFSICYCCSCSCWLTKVCQIANAQHAANTQRKMGFDLTSSAVLNNYCEEKPFDPGNFIRMIF